MNTTANSEIVFGSVSRNDSDKWSDRDIAIVDDCVETLKHRTCSLEENGWSVASYTFKKIAYMAQEGYLFIHHLKNEGRIVIDKGNKLNTILETFRPKKSYALELAYNKKLADLIKICPLSVEGELWAADVLYVSLRNFGILYLADRKMYTYSFQDIIQKLVDEGVICEKSKKNLIELRNMKTVYRSKKYVLRKSIKFSLKEVLNYLPDSAFPKQIKLFYCEDIIRNTSALPNDYPAYHRLRNLERAYVALSGLNLGGVNEEYFALLRKWIEEPRQYSKLAGDCERDILGSLSLLLDSKSTAIISR